MPKWTFQTGTLGNFETTSLLRDNVLYVTGPQNVAWAIDARTGRPDLALPPRAAVEPHGVLRARQSRLRDARRQAVLATLDAHLIALDRRTGTVAWDATFGDYKTGYSSTIAPLAVKDKVIVGVAGGEYGIRGYIEAYEAQTGKRVWRFYTIPGPGEPGNDTWAGDSWKIGGASVWVTGAYDPDQNLLMYGIGNPGPDYHSESRKGDNLYSNSLVALDADTGSAAVALPVHTARPARLGCDRSPDPRRPHDRRAAAQGRDVRQPKRLLLHDRSDDGKADRRASRS